jgi:phage terminase large subunit-like protein
MSGIPDGLHFVSIVVAIDPAVSSTESSDETGIIVAGLGENGHWYILADYSGVFTPLQWATAAIRAYNIWQADVIVAEKNNGGEMITEVLSNVNNKIPVRLVHASRGKRARAEPVAAMWERGEAHLIGVFPELEDQLCTWEPLSGDQSPDRLDAMVWACNGFGTGKVEEVKVKGMH